MPTDKIVVTVVDVGQGQCTFVEIYDATPTLIHTLLFDCGSDKLSDNTYTNLEYIAKKITSLAQPTIDCIFFSHSDKDHIWLTYDLLYYINAEKKKKLKVKKVWYAGHKDLYKKYGYNILNDLVSDGYCTEADEKTTTANYSGYNKSSGKFDEYLWKSEDALVYVYPIVSNVAATDPDYVGKQKLPPTKTAETKNRVSMVCGLYYAGSSYIICGDATNATMKDINTRFKGTTVFKQNLMTTLPHHGSRSTGFAVKSGQEASKGNIEVVNTFAALMKSKTITISAFEKHRHPSLQLINQFNPGSAGDIVQDPRLKEAKAHRLTAYFDIDVTYSKNSKKIGTIAVYSFDTTNNVFSTRYSNAVAKYAYELGKISAGEAKGVTPSGTDINGFACWEYSDRGAETIYHLSGYDFLGDTKFTTEITLSKTAPVNVGQPLLTPAPEPFIIPDPNIIFPPAHAMSQFRKRLQQFR